MRTMRPALGRCLFLVVAATSAALLTLSCGNPITTDLARRIKDDVIPTIVITSPADGSYYATIVEIIGTVTDSSNDGEEGGIGSVAYEVLSTDVAGFAEVTAPGFRIAFATDALAGNLSIRIEAVDWNGNRSEVILNLIEGDSDIPLFEVAAGNGEVTLNWNPVPMA